MWSWRRLVTRRYVQGQSQRRFAGKLATVGPATPVALPSPKGIRVGGSPGAVAGFCSSRCIRRQFSIRAGSRAHASFSASAAPGAVFSIKPEAMPEVAKGPIPGMTQPYILRGSRRQVNVRSSFLISGAAILPGEAMSLLAVSGWITKVVIGSFVCFGPAVPER